MAPQDGRARKRVRASHGPVVLAALLSGVTLEEIAETQGISRKTAERLMRAELRKRWIAPAQDYAKLQIARLEAIATSLKEKAKSGDLPTIDRLLKVLDRLDRYHGFNRFAALTTASREDVRPQLMRRFAQATTAPGDGA
jgi:hypothetical protein